ncbi:MAG: GatB/YqeY domain-containing protein [Anaerolineales bacterium]|jgi:uncharacterized protein YqeY
MITKQELEIALRNAMKSGDEVRKRTIRMVLASIKLVEVEKGTTLSEPELAAILQKEIKIRKEAIQDAEKGNRPDLVEANQAEIKVLEEFLPKQLTEDELIAMAKAVINQVGASSLADVGKVMKVLLPQIKGQAPNELVSKIVRQLLNG